MKDVAARCGISESTVSHVVNNTRPVAPATRDRVLRVMRELHYHGNAHARRLARGHSDFLGLIISDIENPFYPGLIKAFESAALENGFDILLATTNYEPSRGERACQKLIQNRAAGVAVMTSGVEPRIADLLSTASIPAVFLDAGKPGPRRSRIRIDHDAGARSAVNCLYNLGHRDFALVAGPQERASHAAHRAAVASALRARQARARVVEADNTLAGGEQAAARLLATRALPTAILCSNDLTAIGLMRALGRAGFAVPADVSVVGADDVPLAALTSPPLTTIRIPRGDLGATAFAVLREMLNRSSVGVDRVLETDLVIRASSGAARGRALTGRRPRGQG